MPRFYFFLLLCSLCSFFSPLFAQNDTSVQNVDNILEKRFQNITSNVSDTQQAPRMKGYYIPIFSVGFRFGGEHVFNGSTEISTKRPVFGTFFDIQLMRFGTGFAMLRFLVETGMGETIYAKNANINDRLLGSRYILEGGFGGGFNVFDTRLKSLGIGHLASVYFMGTGGGYFGKANKPREILGIFGGLQLGTRYHYYFKPFTALQVGFELGFRVSLVSSVNYNIMIGFSF